MKDYEGCQICCTPDTLGVSEAQRWPTNAISWHIDTTGYRGNLTGQQMVDAFLAAWKGWTDELMINAELVKDISQAIIRKHFGSIDGPGGTLAWAELANGTMSPKRMRFDSLDVWTDQSPPPQGQILLEAVASHEIGHSLGLQHGPANSGELMQPTYSWKIRKPTARDIERAVKLGYSRRPQTSPPPANPKPPGTEKAILIEESNGVLKIKAVGYTRVELA